MPVHDLSDLLDVGIIRGMRAPSWVRRIGGSAGGTAWPKARMVLARMLMRLVGARTTYHLRGFVSKSSGM